MTRIGAVMTEDDAAQMRREYLADLVAAHRAAQAVGLPVLGWVRDPRWEHRPSDDFEGCTE